MRVQLLWLVVMSLAAETMSQSDGTSGLGISNNLAQCDDIAGFVDQAGYGCADWAGYDCTDLEGNAEWGYTLLTLGTVVAHCPFSCGLCSKWPIPNHHLTREIDCSSTKTGNTLNAVQPQTLVGADAGPYSAYEHVYNFTINYPGIFTFDGCSSSYNVRLRILTINQSTTIAGCEQCGCPHARRAALRDIFLPQGSYLLAVGGKLNPLVPMDNMVDFYAHGEYVVKVSPPLCTSELVADECHDDKGGFLEVQGHTCESLLAIPGISGCNFDLSALISHLPSGTTLRLLCPNYCENIYIDETSCNHCPSCEQILNRGLCETSLGLSCVLTCPLATDSVNTPYGNFTLGRSRAIETSVGKTSTATSCAELVKMRLPLAFGATYKVSPVGDDSECRAVQSKLGKLTIDSTELWETVEFNTSLHDNEGFTLHHCSSEKNEASMEWFMKNGRHRHSDCEDKDELLVDSKPGVVCATIAMACACETAAGATEACCKSCPRRSNPLSQHCSCVDDDEWARSSYESYVPTIVSCAKLAAEGWCYREHPAPKSTWQLDLGINVRSHCCKSCPVISNQTCMPDESPVALAKQLDSEVAMHLSDVIAEMIGADEVLSCSTLFSGGMCGLVKEIFTSYFGTGYKLADGRTTAPTIKIAEAACPHEFEQCSNIVGCLTELHNTLHDQWRNDAGYDMIFDPAPSQYVLDVCWCLVAVIKGPEPQFDAFVDTADDVFPCKQTCTACDLGAVCQSLLTRPMHTWSRADTMDWLQDSVGMTGLDVISALSSADLDGLGLQVLLGSGATEWASQLGISLSTAKQLSEFAETYASPTDLDRAPSRGSCSRLALPLAVDRSISISDFLTIDDRSMEFQLELSVETSWPDDRVAYMPSSSYLQLGSCSQLCFDVTVNTLPEGSPTPPEASKCCDALWIPRVIFTNAKEVTEIESPQVSWSAGMAILRERVRVTLKSSMSFDTFPFDSQDLSMEMQVMGSTDASVLITTGNVAMDQRVWDVGVLGWEISQDPVNIVSAASKGELSYSTSTVTIHVSRVYSEFVGTYLVAIIILVTLSWIAFALKTTQIEARLASTATLVLALMALSDVVSSALPGGDTPVHKFMMQANVTIMLIGLQSIIVYGLSVVAEAKVAERSRAGRCKAVLMSPGEAFDMACTFGFTVALIVQLKILFPPLSLTDFVIYGPLLVGVILMASQIMIDEYKICGRCSRTCRARKVPNETRC
jgi:hypothetical protein